MVSLERVEELEENLVLGPIASDDIRVLGSVVDALDVLDTDAAGAVSVHNAEGAQSETPTEVVHLATDFAQELLVGDGLGAVSVENSESAESLLISQAEAKLSESLRGLLDVELTVAVVIVDSENTAETHDTASATRDDLLANHLN